MKKQKVVWVKIKKEELDNIKKDSDNYNRWYRDAEKERQSLKNQVKCNEYVENETIRILEGELRDYKILLAGMVCKGENPFTDKTRVI